MSAEPATYLTPEWSKKAFERVDKAVTTRDIKDYLAKKYDDKSKYIAIEELRPGTGGSKHAEQAIDYWVLSCYPSDRFLRISYEIKISRADFLKELKNPLKRRIALALSNSFYFIAPEGLIKPAEVPEECGLVEIFWYEEKLFERLSWSDRTEGKAPAVIDTRVVMGSHVAITAPHRDPPVLSWALVASIGRRLNNGR